MSTMPPANAPFPSDLAIARAAELAPITEIADAAGAHVAVGTHVRDGGAGALELAQVVVDACNEPTDFRYSYDLDDSLRDKINTLATQVYGADGITFSTEAARELARYEELGYGRFPVVIAKTHLSISSDPTLRGAPTGWRMPVREVRAAVGAGYISAICGDMRTMPGLAKTPAAASIDLDEDGQIVGLF